VRTHRRPGHRCAAATVRPAGRSSGLERHRARRRGLRVDLFRAFGRSLSRACTLDQETGELEVLAVEDLVARITAFVDGHLRYSAEPAACERCRAHGSFRPAPPERIVEILGYC
jgi:hypothetical protein